MPNNTHKKIPKVIVMINLINRNYEGKPGFYRPGRDPRKKNEIPAKFIQLMEDTINVRS